MKHYISFTIFFDAVDFPVSLGTLLRFIAMLGRGSGASKSARNVISSIKWFTSFIHPPSLKVFESVMVSSSIRGLDALLSRPPRQKLPFTLKHLCSFYNLLSLDDPKQLASWCAMLLSFFACFRLSNLVPHSKSNFDPLKHLQRDDIRFEGSVLLVFYKWSKTNQCSRKVSWIPICSVDDPRFNIKFYFNKLFTLVNAPGNAPLFSFARKDFHSRYSLVRSLDSCVFRAGLTPADYIWHSFRRGAAVFAFELGLPDSAVQLFGDWSSAAFKNYLEFALLRKISIAESVAKSFDKEVKLI